MSDPRAHGLLSAIAEPIGQEIARHFQAPPLHRNQNRAFWGTGLLAFGGYFGHAFYLADRAHSLPEVVGDYVRLLHAPFGISWPFYAWGAAMPFGLLWVTIGVRGARGPREIMGAFWSAAWAGLLGVALWFGWYPDDIPVLSWWLKGFYIAAFSAALMHFFLSARGLPGNARRMVEADIAASDLHWE